MAKEVRVWLGPEQPAELAAAIEGAGATLTPAAEANAIVWSGGRHPAELLREALHPGIEWVQLDSAGIERWLEADLLDHDRIWTGAQGVYAANVAEHVLAFVLAAARGLVESARRVSWSEVAVERVRGRTVGIVGAGGIGRETIRRLAPFGVRTLALTRSGAVVPGADRSLPAGGLHELLAESDDVVLAAPLTPATHGFIGARELELIGPKGWLHNVGRGQLVQTDALVTALESGRLGGACLDVTDPEPLPEGHPLWRLPNVLVTPHVANPWFLHYDLLAERVGENVARFREERELLGVIDPDRSY